MMHPTEAVHASDKMSSGFCCVGYQYFLEGTAQLPIVCGGGKDFSSRRVNTHKSFTSLHAVAA